MVVVMAALQSAKFSYVKRSQALGARHLSNDCSFHAEPIARRTAPEHPSPVSRTVRAVQPVSPCARTR